MTGRALLLAAALALPALAPGKPASPAATAPRKGSALPPVRTLTADELRGMSLKDLQDRGARHVADMDAAVRAVLDTMAQAVKANDFPRINCVSEALTVMKGLLRLSGQNEIALREQVINGNRPGAEHEYVKLHIASQRIAQMQAQAASCGGPGGDSIFAGAPILEQRFDPDLPVEDMRKVLLSWYATVEPPPSASPFY